MFEAGTIFDYEVYTARKGMNFHFKWDGCITLIEPATKKNILDEIKEQFLQNINKSLVYNRYTMNEIMVKISLKNA